MEDLAGMIILGIISFFSAIIGIAFITWSKKLKQNKDKPTNPNVRKATVIDVKEESRRDFDGYIRNREYHITVEYEKDGELQVRTFKYPFMYETGSVINIVVSSYGLVNVISDKPNNQVENIKELKGHNIAFIVGIFFLIYPTMFVLSLILQLLNTTALGGVNIGDMFGLLVLGVLECGLFCGGMFFIKKSKKMKQDMEDGTMPAIKAKIVDVRKKTSKNSESYLPIVEYMDNGELHTVELDYSSEYRTYDIGKEITIYKDKVKNKVVPEGADQAWMAPAWIMFVFMGFFMIPVISELFRIF